MATLIEGPPRDVREVRIPSATTNGELAHRLSGRTRPRRIGESALGLVLSAVGGLVNLAMVLGLFLAPVIALVLMVLLFAVVIEGSALLLHAAGLIA
jgi:hypothetical protein